MTDEMNENDVERVGRIVFGFEESMFVATLQFPDGEKRPVACISRNLVDTEQQIHAYMDFIASSMAHWLARSVGCDPKNIARSPTREVTG